MESHEMINLFYFRSPDQTNPCLNSECNKTKILKLKQQKRDTAFTFPLNTVLPTIKILNMSKNKKNCGVKFLLLILVTPKTQKFTSKLTYFVKRALSTTGQSSSENS